MTVGKVLRIVYQTGFLTANNQCLQDMEVSEEEVQVDDDDAMTESVKSDGDARVVDDDDQDVSDDDANDQEEEEDAENEPEELEEEEEDVDDDEEKDEQEDEVSTTAFLKQYMLNVSESFLHLHLPLLLPSHQNPRPQLQNLVSRSS